DKHGLPPTKRLFKVTQLEPTPKLIRSWGIEMETQNIQGGRRYLVESRTLSPSESKISSLTSGEAKLYKFPLPVKIVATARRKEMPLPEVCTAIEEKKKKLLIQQYLQHEHYVLWELIEFGDSYKVPTNTDPNDTTRRKDDEQSGRTVSITIEDMQRKKNDVKAITTLLLSLPDEHQLRFSKYTTLKELWAAILKTFGGNEATKKRKKNILKKQYGNFKAEGSETLEQTFNRLQVIVSQLQFMDVEVEKDDPNQKFLTSLAPEWMMHTIIDEDDMKEMDIKWSMALLSMRADKFWKGTRKKISIQGSDVVGFDKSKVEFFNCHKMGYFARECRAPRSQERGRKESYRKGPKTEEKTPKALMAIDEVG
nr:hypothetical protein [Tanacetum cinerariifolium]